MLIDDLRLILNRYKRDNDSDTPDWILAEYMLKSLRSAEELVKQRDKWNGMMKSNRS